MQTCINLRIHDGIAFRDLDQIKSNQIFDLLTSESIHVSERMP